MTFRPVLTFALLGGLAGCASSAAAERLTEQDYFSDLPEVLTVTRLAQPLSETPGAVTVIDRETIRRSGARELADVLRLVPGYFVAGWNGANPGAVYHTPLDDYGTRNLVLIDGRSAYSSFFLGDTHRGMMTVLLEDIERVEVLRGSNSAAYGANAMFGVINIVTRHSADTPGTMFGVTGGQGGIADGVARIGWGDETASFRLSAGRRADSGYGNVRDDKSIRQMHLRGDLRPAADQEAMLAVGAAELATGEGLAGNVGFPPHTTHWRDFYVQGQWRRQLSVADEVQVRADFSEETVDDSAPYKPLPGLMLDYGGTGRRANLEMQHGLALADGLRAVWGAGYKYESARSAALYHTGDDVSFNEQRLFGNLEWRLHPQWLVNAGGFWGRHSRAGTYFVPRLMANFHVVPDHTLRFGTTESVRTPTLFEYRGDVRYYYGGTLVGRTTAARGNVEPEMLRSDEIGYFGNFRNLRLTLDVRAFNERMHSRIATEGYRLADPLPVTGRKVEDFVNNPGMRLTGIEYQLRWKPADTTEIWLNQAFIKQRWDDGWDNRLPPTHASTLALFQKLPLGFDLGLMYHRIGTMSWRSDEDRLPPRHRLDARLAYAFRAGAMPAEAALTVQAANGDYAEFLPREGFRFERRAFVTLRFGF